MKRTIEVTPTPEELAEAFAGMSSSQQAIVLNRLAREPWWPTQLQYITGESILTGAARNLMRLIGEYASDHEIVDDYAIKVKGAAT